MSKLNAVETRPLFGFGALAFGHARLETTSVNKKVLIVDDDPMIAEYYKHMLEERFDVEASSDPAEALARVKAKGPYAAVVSDLVMPGMSGVEFLRRVAELSPNTARVVLTGHATLEAALQAVNESRVFGFLEKSCDVGKLAQTLDEAVRSFNKASRKRPRKTSGVLTDEEISFLTGRG